MSNFHATDKGVEEATANVEEFIQRSEPDRSLPQSVRDARVNDVHALEVGGDINYVRVHPAPDA